MKIKSIAQSSLAVATLMLGPVHSFATTAGEAPYCIAVNGGFDNTGYSGSTFVARNFSMPDANKCSVWTGYTKTSATVIFTTNGTACLSSDSLALTVSVTSQDPSYLGFEKLAVDYIGMTRTSTTEPFSGEDQGYLAGGAATTSCTSDLLILPATHD